MILGLCWMHCPQDAAHLPERRPDFPSWSWAGWKGQAIWLRPSRWDHAVREIGLDSDDETLCVLRDAGSTIPSDLISFLNRVVALHFDVWVIQQPTVSIGKNQDGNTLIKNLLINDIYTELYLSSFNGTMDDFNCRLRKGSLVFAVIANFEFENGGSSLSSRSVCLILERSSRTDAWTRVGIAHMYHSRGQQYLSGLYLKIKVI
jgi:hypothetical protein